MFSVFWLMSFDYSVSVSCVFVSQRYVLVTHLCLPIYTPVLPVLVTESCPYIGMEPALRLLCLRQGDCCLELDFAAVGP